MIKAMQQIEEESKEPICYIISGDLAHIGPKFGDSQLVSPAQLDHCEKQDIQLMQQAEAVDLQGYFQTIVGEKDDRRICGFPPTFTTLQAVRPSFGKVLHYNQYVHPQGHETVSFASVAFYK